VATDYAEFLLLPALLKALSNEAPKIDVWISPFGEDATAALQRGEVDLVIGIPPPTAISTTLHAQSLIEDRFVCLVRARHPLSRSRLTVARFAAANHILISPRGRAGGPVDDALATRNARRHVGIAVPHFLAAPHIVAETDLVLTVAARIAASFTTVLPLRSLELPFEVRRFASPCCGTTAFTPMSRTSGCGRIAALAASPESTRVWSAADRPTPIILVYRRAGLSATRVVAGRPLVRRRTYPEAGGN
jgi:DNA-binding transcriptional LysR family regulator